MHVLMARSNRMFNHFSFSVKLFDLTVIALFLFVDRMPEND